MQIKSGVRILGLRPEMLLAVIAAESIWQRHDVELVITSGIDGKHSVGSFHYNGLGLDFRTNSMSASAAEMAVNELKQALGDDFDVILEVDHCHCEFQPKQSY